MAGRLHGENVASCGTRENVGISRRPRLRKYDPARQVESLPDAQRRRVQALDRAFIRQSLRPEESGVVGPVWAVRSARVGGPPDDAARSRFPDVLLPLSGDAVNS